MLAPRKRILSGKAENSSVAEMSARRGDDCLSEGFGPTFIDYYLRIKDTEVARYQSEVTEWEQREYFELF
ncbi:MAG TPA: hypothetical protein VH678_21260 [Xanthobacteraceae bacterium]